MNSRHTPGMQERVARRKHQQEQLRDSEAELRTLAGQGKREEFFKRIVPLIGPLREHIKRRLRVACLDMKIRTPLYTSGDILDEVILRAYENYSRKPQALTLEQWLYQTANEVLESYVNKRSSIDARRKSQEALWAKEMGTLEEKPTADAEGEPVLEEDLDDISYHQRDFTPPADNDNPEMELERKEQLQQMLHALAEVPERDRIIFELFAIEGFTSEEVGRIIGVNPEEVPQIVSRVREHVLRRLRTSMEKAS